MECQARSYDDIHVKQLERVCQFASLPLVKQTSQRGVRQELQAPQTAAVSLSIHQINVDERTTVIRLSESRHGGGSVHKDLERLLQALDLGLALRLALRVGNHTALAGWLELVDVLKDRIHGLRGLRLIRLVVTNGLSEGRYLGG